MNCFFRMISAREVFEFAILEYCYRLYMEQRTVTRLEALQVGHRERCQDFAQLCQLAARMWYSVGNCVGFLLLILMGILLFAIEKRIRKHWSEAI